MRYFLPYEAFGFGLVFFASLWPGKSYLAVFFGLPSYVGQTPSSSRGFCVSLPRGAGERGKVSSLSGKPSHSIHKQTLENMKMTWTKYRNVNEMRESPLMRALATWLGWRILDRSAILLRPLNHEWYYYHHHLQECNHRHLHKYLPNDAYLTFDFPPCCHCHRVVISLLMALKRTYQVNH